MLRPPLFQERLFDIVPGGIRTLDPRPGACEKAPETRGTNVPPTKPLTEGQRAYEAKRAAKAGMSLEKWLASKEREREAEAKATLKAVQAAKPPEAAGLFRASAGARSAAAWILASLPTRIGASIRASDG